MPWSLLRQVYHRGIKSKNFSWLVWFWSLLLLSNSWGISSSGNSSSFFDDFGVDSGFLILLSFSRFISFKQCFLYLDQKNIEFTRKNN